MAPHAVSVVDSWQDGDYTFAELAVPTGDGPLNLHRVYTERENGELLVSLTSMLAGFGVSSASITEILNNPKLSGSLKVSRVRDGTRGPTRCAL